MIKNIIITAIKIYKKIFFNLRSFRFPVILYTDCKFYPSCSDYAIEAINKHGTFLGLIKTIIRILKCSPFSKGGIDLP